MMSKIYDVVADRKGGHEPYSFGVYSSREEAEAVLAEKQAQLAVLPTEVVNAADWWVAADRAVGSVVVVVLEPVWQSCGAVL